MPPVLSQPEILPFWMRVNCDGGGQASAQAGRSTW